MILPYSKDGSTFDRSCRYKDGFFRIGPKGREIKIRCFYRALGMLACMAVPRWRRPNRKGNFGLVIGQW